MKTSMHLMLLLIFIFSSKAKAQSCQALFNAENVVQIKNNQIVVNGIPQPVKHTGEIQYFRLRGGYEKDVPRERVVAAWANALDNAVKMGADSMSFYIPWDFHEYAPGKFDFTGTADQNGNGLADYPSRDLLGFLKMAQDRGIKKILLRPGPYINAEWGFLGFGAVPEWFHNQYPNSHMQDARGFKTKLYNYHDEDFLRHTKFFFEELNRQVLVHLIGKDKPAIFLQLDNETNLQWQSIYNAGYEPAQVIRYQSFLKTRYPDLAGLNRAQGTSFQTWQEVAPPKASGLNLTQDQDWYRFQDRNIYDYIRKLKKKSAPYYLLTELGLFFLYMIAYLLYNKNKKMNTLI